MASESSSVSQGLTSNVPPSVPTAPSQTSTLSIEAQMEQAVLAKDLKKIKELMTSKELAYANISSNGIKMLHLALEISGEGLSAKNKFMAVSNAVATGNITLLEFFKKMGFPLVPPEKIDDSILNNDYFLLLLALNNQQVESFKFLVNNCPFEFSPDMVWRNLPGFGQIIFLHTATHYYPFICFMIEKYSANVLKIKTNSNYTAFHAAAQANNLEVLKLIVKLNPACILEKTDDKRNALHFATNPTVLRYLIEIGVNIIQRNARDQTPLERFLSIANPTENDQACMTVLNAAEALALKICDFAGSSRTYSFIFNNDSQNRHRNKWTRKTVGELLSLGASLTQLQAPDNNDSTESLLHRSTGHPGTTEYPNERGDELEELLQFKPNPYMKNHENKTAIECIETTEHCKKLKPYLILKFYEMIFEINEKKLKGLLLKEKVETVTQHVFRIIITRVFNNSYNKTFSLDHGRLLWIKKLFLIPNADIINYAYDLAQKLAYNPETNPEVQKLAQLEIANLVKAGVLQNNNAQLQAMDASIDMFYANHPCFGNQSTTQNNDNTMETKRQAEEVSTKRVQGLDAEEPEIMQISDTDTPGSGKEEKKNSEETKIQADQHRKQELAQLESELLFRVGTELGEKHGMSDRLKDIVNQFRNKPYNAPQLGNLEDNTPTLDLLREHNALDSELRQCRTTLSAETQQLDSTEANLKELREKKARLEVEQQKLQDMNQKLRKVLGVKRKIEETQSTSATENSPGATGQAGEKPSSKRLKS